MPPTRDNGNEDDVELDEPDWRAALTNVRAMMREELGDKSIDIDDIIHTMREERDAQLLSATYGEEEAAAMVWGRRDLSDEAHSSSETPGATT